MRTRTLIGSAILVAFVVMNTSGCTWVSRGPVSLAGRLRAVSPSPSATTSFDDAVSGATRRYEIYQGLMREADARATLITPALRERFRVERRRFHGRFADAVDKEFSRSDADATIDVFLAFYASDPKLRDVWSSKSPWDITLLRGNAEVRLASIHEMVMTPAVGEIFPQVDRFDGIYWLRFPAGATSGGEVSLTAGPPPLVLSVRSAVGEALLEWQLTP